MFASSGWGHQLLRDDGLWCRVCFRDWKSRASNFGLHSCPLQADIPPDSFNSLMALCSVEGERSGSLPVFLWGALFKNTPMIFSHVYIDKAEILSPSDEDALHGKSPLQSHIDISCFFLFFVLFIFIYLFRILTSTKLLPYQLFFWTCCTIHLNRIYDQKVFFFLTADFNRLTHANGHLIKQVKRFVRKTGETCIAQKGICKQVRPGDTLICCQSRNGTLSCLYMHRTGRCAPV